MKNTYLTTVLLLAVVIAISLLGLHTDNKVIGQTQDSSSSSSSGDVVTSSSSSSSSGEVVTSSSSSSSGVIVLNKDFTGVWKAKVSRCIPVQATSSSSSVQVVTSSSSSGGTELCVDQGSVVITLKLCVRDGKLEGVLHQGGVFDKAVIDSQTIISQDEVVVNLKDKPATATL